MKAAAANRPKQAAMNPAVNPVSDMKDKGHAQNNALTFDSLGNAVNFGPNKAKLEEEERKKKLEAEKRKKEQEEKSKKPLDKSRPISSTPIAGTPWYVICLTNVQVRTFIHLNFFQVCGLDRRRSRIFLQSIGTYVIVGASSGAGKSSGCR